MTRRFAGGKLVIASHNRDKVDEIRHLLAPLGTDVVSAGELALIEPEETGETFRENARIKAAAAIESGLPALADDSGLSVAALGGRPGVHSARWAGPGKDFNIAMKRVEEALAGQSDRSAHFACVLALGWPDGHMETFEGAIHGRLVWPPRGNKGFGYDPVFVPDGFQVTFAEMEAAQKHALSHRGQALAKLVAACFKG